jgi:hypothetical protein
MPRVPAVRREDLDEPARAIYDAIAASRGPEFIKQGPFGVLFTAPNSPAVPPTWGATSATRVRCRRVIATCWR